MNFRSLVLAIAALLTTTPSVVEAVWNSYRCNSFMVAVPITNVTTVVPPFPPFADEYAATAFANQITLRDAVTPQVNLTSITKTYNISAEYCVPRNPGKHVSSTIQILTHGIGFNRSYWNFYLPSQPKNTQYSYVHSATQAGYSTLSWNRLGIAPSTIADPYAEIQSTVELAVLISLTRMVRQGKIPQIAKRPRKIVHVGHSWGSFMTNGLAVAAPTLTDGIVLTGFSHRFQYEGLFVASTSMHLASQNQPTRFPATQYSFGFLTWPDKQANQYCFFSYPYFDPQVLVYGESVKFPFTAGEFLTQNLFPLNTTDEFKAPVLYLAAEHDLIFCGSDCKGFFGPQSTEVLAFTNSSNGHAVETYIQPNVGHGINLHKNATGAYGVVMDWAKRHGF